jgi:hypothetical protein
MIISSGVLGAKVNYTSPPRLVIAWQLSVYELIWCCIVVILSIKFINWAVCSVVLSIYALLGLPVA